MAEDAAVVEEKKGIKMEEVEKHSSIDDLWLVIDGACGAPRDDPKMFDAPPRARRAGSRLFRATRADPLDDPTPAGKVYDVTPFMDDHPGGGEIMLSAAGKDGTQDFEDVGHSPHARELLKKYYIDEFAGGVGSGLVAQKAGGGGMSFMAVILPILVVLMAFAAKYLTA